MTWSKRVSSYREGCLSEARAKRIQAEKCGIDVCNHKRPRGQDEDSEAELGTYAQGNSHRNTQGGKQCRGRNTHGTNCQS